MVMVSKWNNLILRSRIKYDLKNAPDAKRTIEGNFVRKVGLSRRHPATQLGLSTLGEPGK
jgi:hypothetical protein